MWAELFHICLTSFLAAATRGEPNRSYLFLYTQTLLLNLDEHQPTFTECGSPFQKLPTPTPRETVNKLSMKRVRIRLLTGVP